MHHPRCEVFRQLELDRDAFSGLAANVELATQEPGPLLHASQTESHRLARCRFRTEAGAVIRDAQPDTLIGLSQAKVYMRRLGMFRDIL
jgi:hypothetical protein